MNNLTDRIKITLFVDIRKNSITINNLQGVYEPVDFFNFKNGDGGKGFGIITDKNIGGSFVCFAM